MQITIIRPLFRFFLNTKISNYFVDIREPIFVHRYIDSMLTDSSEFFTNSKNEKWYDKSKILDFALPVAYGCYDLGTINPWLFSSTILQNCLRFVP